MGIDLRGRDILVPEHLLDFAQARTVTDEVSGKAMPHYVRGNRVWQVCQASVLPDDPLHAPGSQSQFLSRFWVVYCWLRARVPDKYRMVVIIALPQVSLYPLRRSVGQKDYADLATFTYDPKLARFQVDRGFVQ